MQRINFLASVGAALPLLTAQWPARAADEATARLAGLEKETGGRLGVVALHPGSGRSITYRSSERFAMCSTFKFLAVSAVLSRVDREEEWLDRPVTYTQADLLDWAPITKKHVGEGSMTLGALCEAAMDYSDNTAANLILRILGGPHAVTAFARAIGDRITRLDRTEPSLNEAKAGDVRDTTTPAAMAANMQKILLGSVLSAASRNRLAEWLVSCKTGTDLLRSGMPTVWKVGDKTGLGGANNAVGDSDTRNDIAIAWPPTDGPLLITTYLTQSRLSAVQRDAAIAQVGRIVTRRRPPSPGEKVREA